MIASATPLAPLVLSAALACSACAATEPPGTRAGRASAPIDVDRPCMAGRWQAAARGDAVTVSADNRCARPLTCDVDLQLATLAGPELYLDCRDRSAPIGRTEALCRWAGQPAVSRGSGSMRCR